MRTKWRLQLSMVRMLVLFGIASIYLTDCSTSSPSGPIQPGVVQNDTAQQQAREIPVESLHPEIRKIYDDPDIGAGCGKPMACGNIVMIDCGQAFDGPLNYYDNTTGEVLMYCGGACMLPDSNDPKACKACPPLEWECTDLSQESVDSGLL